MDKRKIEIVNGNRQKWKLSTNNTNGNHHVCGTKINMGNEKYQNGNRQTAIPQWD